MLCAFFPSYNMSPWPNKPIMPPMPIAPTQSIEPAYLPMAQ